MYSYEGFNKDLVRFWEEEEAVTVNCEFCDRTKGFKLE